MRVGSVHYLVVKRTVIARYSRSLLNSLHLRGRVTRRFPFFKHRTTSTFRHFQIVGSSISHFLTGDLSSFFDYPFAST